MMSCLFLISCHEQFLITVFHFGAYSLLVAVVKVVSSMSVASSGGVFKVYFCDWERHWLYPQSGFFLITFTEHNMHLPEKRKAEES